MAEIPEDRLQVLNEDRPFRYPVPLLIPVPFRYPAAIPMSADSL